MSKVIVLATSKGGAGKSTLTRSLASHWLHSGLKPAIIDADPQASIIKYHDNEGPLNELQVFANPEEEVSSLIVDKKRGFNPLIVDTGGFRNKTTVRALISSDIALIPLKPSADDVAGALDTHNLIKELNSTPERSGNPILYRMILTMTQQGTVIARHVRQELEEMGYFEEWVSFSTDGYLDESSEVAGLTRRQGRVCSSCPIQVT